MPNSPTLQPLFFLVVCTVLCISLAISLFGLKDCSVRKRFLYAACPLSQLAVLMAAELFVLGKMVPSWLVWLIGFLSLAGALYDVFLVQAFAAEERVCAEYERMALMHGRLERTRAQAERAALGERKIEDLRERLSLWLVTLAAQLDAGEYPNELKMLSGEEMEMRWTRWREFDAMLEIRYRNTTERGAQTSFDIEVSEASHTLGATACVFTACILDALFESIPATCYQAELFVRIRCSHGYLTVDVGLKALACKLLASQLDEKLGLAYRLAAQCDGNVDVEIQADTAQVNAVASLRQLALIDNAEITTGFIPSELNC